jgi:uncharacterized membrane protein
LCVFLPGIPNPLSGRLVIVERELCLPLPLSMDEAFKFLLSTGNYLPPELRGLADDRPTAAGAGMVQPAGNDGGKVGPA